MEPQEIFEEFKDVGLQHMSEREVYDTMERLRYDSIEDLLIKHNLLTKEEIEHVTAAKMKKVIQFLKTKPLKSPIQDINPN